VATALKEYRPEPQVRDDFWSKLGITAEGSALHALVHEGFHDPSDDASAPLQERIV
jgi:hypothetical protein